MAAEKSWWEKLLRKAAEKGCWERLLRKAAEKGCWESCWERLLKKGAEKSCWEKLLKKAAKKGCWERLPRRLLKKAERLLRKAAEKTLLFVKNLFFFLRGVGSAGPQRETTLSSLRACRTLKTVPNANFVRVGATLWSLRARRGSKTAAKRKLLSSPSNPFVTSRTGFALEGWKIKYVLFQWNYIMLHDYKLLSKERCTYKFGPIYMYLVFRKHS